MERGRGKRGEGGDRGRGKRGEGGDSGEGRGEREGIVEREEGRGRG